MLPRIVLLVLQVAAGLWAVPPIKAALPALLARPYDILLTAVIMALVIVIVGYAGALVLKGIGAPSSRTLVVALLLAVLLAGLSLVPQVTQAIDAAVPALRSWPQAYPLVGALLGYYLKR